MRSNEYVLNSCCTPTIQALHQTRNTSFNKTIRAFSNHYHFTVCPHAVTPSTAHHDRLKNRIANSQSSIGSNGMGALASAVPATARASDDASAGSAPFSCSRPATTSTAKTASRTALWCSQCVVRCHPRVASATSLIVALQIGGAFCHGNAAGSVCEVATSCKRA